MTLAELGWDERWADAFRTVGGADLQPGRVAIEFNHLYRVFVDGGAIETSASGRLKHHAARRSELPAVGDWVAVRTRPGEQRGAIIAVLPRRTRFSRRA